MVRADVRDDTRGVGDARTDGIRWGYWEYGAQRQAVPVRVMGHTNYVFPYQRAGVHLTLFHILVGEGVSRLTFESAVMDAAETQDEIWVQEHNVHGQSWKHPAAGPRGTKIIRRAKRIRSSTRSRS